MKRVKTAFFGAAILALSILAASCENGTTDSDNNKNPADNKEASSDVKKITVTGLNTSGKVYIGVGEYTTYDNGNEKGIKSIAQGEATITNGSVTVSLRTSIEKDSDAVPVDWKGSGLYYIGLGIEQKEPYTQKSYFYTQGKTLDSLGIDTSKPEKQWEYTKLPQYDIKKTTTTIAFSNFILYATYPETTN